jgi:hypothetical protein
MRNLILMLIAVPLIAAPQDPITTPESNIGFSNGSFAPISSMVFSEIPDIQTTDATETTIHNITMPDPSTYLVKTACEARKSDGTKREAYEKMVLVYRSGGGANIEGSIVTGFSQAGGTYSFTYGVSGNDLEIKVTGAASETVDWRCTVCNQKLE